MNLKEAARAIGVHYQTAYKWVRSGDLAAVRIGSRYEVSQAAVDQFLANRRTLADRTDPSPDEYRHVSDEPPEDFLEELEVMAGDPIVTIPALETFAARRAVEVLGETCLIAVDTADGSVRHSRIDHPRADHAAFYNAVIGLSGPTLMAERGFLGGALTRGESVLMPIVDQVALRRSLKAELRQYLDVYPIHSLVGAPVLVRDALRGVLVFTRDRAGRPYTREDEHLVRRIAARLGPLVQTADEIDEAWRLRRTLADILCCELVHRPPGRPFTGEELHRLLFAPGAAAAATDLAIVVTAPDETVLAVNPGFERWTGIPERRICGSRRRESVPDDVWEREARNYERLRRGEIDFDDFHGWRFDRDGNRFEVAVHRVAVREPDASLSCVVSVARPVHHIGPDVPDVPAAPIVEAVSAVQSH